MSTSAVISSEWIKIRSLRSTVGSLIAVAVVTVGISAMVCGLRSENSAASATVDPLALTFAGLGFGQVAAISFGVLAVSQEFHHGAIRVWLAAVPGRDVFYVAKMVTVGGVTLLVGVLTALVTFVLGRALLGSSIGLTDAATLRAIAGSGIYLALMALFAAGLTTLVRSGTLVLSVLNPFILIFPYIFNDVASGVIDYLPDAAGRLLVQQSPDGPIGPWTALGVTAAWTVAALVAGWLALRRRDA